MNVAVVGEQLPLSWLAAVMGSRVAGSFDKQLQLFICTFQLPGLGGIAGSIEAQQNGVLLHDIPTVAAVDPFQCMPRLALPCPTGSSHGGMDTRTMNAISATYIYAFMLLSRACASARLSLSFTFSWAGTLSTI
jgi:hypothetical protein